MNQACNLESAIMKSPWPALAALSALAAMSLAAQAQSVGVVVLLRTYTSATSPDEPCIQAGRTEAELPTLRLTCPSSVQMEAVANAEAGWSMAHEHMTAGSFALNHYRLQNPGVSAQRHGAAPMELRLTW